MPVDETGQGTDHMKQEKGNQGNQVNHARRQFLIAAKGAGALGAIAVLAGKGVELELAATTAVPAAAPAGSDYHETEHIRKYYRSTLY